MDVLKQLLVVHVNIVVVHVKECVTLRAVLFVAEDVHQVVVTLVKVHVVFLHAKIFVEIHHVLLAIVEQWHALTIVGHHVQAVLVVQIVLTIVLKIAMIHVLMVVVRHVV